MRCSRAITSALMLMCSACSLLFNPATLSRDVDANEEAELPDVVVDTERPPEGGGGGRVSDAPVVSTPTICTADAILCDTFDDAATVGAMWTAATLSGVGSLQLDTSQVVSAPHALVVKATSPKTAVGPHLRLTRLTPSDVHVAFDLRLDVVDLTARYSLLVFNSPPSGADNGLWRISILGRAQKLYLSLEIDDQVTERELGATSLLKSFERVVVDVRPSEGIVSVSIGGTVVASENPPRSLRPGFDVQLGLPLVQSVQAMVIRYDDVLIVP